MLSFEINHYAFVVVALVLNHKTGPWGSRSLLCNGYRVCAGGKAAGSWR